MAGKKISPMWTAVLVFFLLLGVLISIRATGLGNYLPNPVGAALNYALGPVENVLLKVGTEIRDDGRAIFSFWTVARENEDLRRKVEQLTGDNITLKQEVLAGMRYDALDKGEFNSPTLDKHKKVGASIINRSVSAWYQTLTINRGSNDGVKVNDPIISNLAVVGKVISVTPTTSEVLLILDGEGQVSALVRGSTGEATFGIVQGTYKQGSRLSSDGELQMMFKRDDNVNVGDLVLTSGYGGVYPKDIPIGTVREIRLDSSGLLKTAIIEPLVNFDILEEVYVVLMTGGQ